MESYNLYFAAQIKNDRLFERTEAVRSGRKQPLKLKSHERKCLDGLISDLFPLCPSPAFFDGFVFSYTIPHIGKEFDLLKISDIGILNIELKSSNIGSQSIREQLLKNKYYLSHLSKPVTLFTYVLKGNAYYTLNDQDELVTSSNHEVALALSLFAGEYVKDLDPLFKACKYLISPVADPERFISGNYFLTQHQQYAKNRIISKEFAGGMTALTGSVGTGKTLLLYDLCKTLSSCEKKCLFLYPGSLKPGHTVFGNRLKNMTVRSLSEADRILLEKYDAVFVDEVNKMSREQFLKLTKNCSQRRFSLFITYDPDGNTSLVEKREGICALIENNKSIRKIRLTNTIRTNENILSFCKIFFGGKYSGPTPSKDLITILYLPKDAIEKTIRYYEDKGYAVFHCPTEHVDLEHPVSFSESEKGVIVAGSGYRFNKSWHLMCTGFRKNEEQILIGRLKRAMLRVREKLVLIVSDEAFYEDLLSVFERG